PLDYDDKSDSTHYLTEKLNNTNKMFQKIPSNSTREANLDAAVIASLTKLSRQKASHIQSDVFNFSMSEFISKQKIYVNDPSDSLMTIDGWKSLGRLALSYLHEPSGANFLYGTYFPKDPTLMKRERKTTKKNETDSIPITQPSAPEKLQQQLVNSEEATTDEVDRILKILKTCFRANGNQPIEFFKFILDPTSFSLTVENLFHLSFLVRDNWVKLVWVDEVLYILPKTAEKSRNRSELDVEIDENTNHMIFNMTYKIWKQLIDAYDMQDSQPMIKPQKNK
ncbi:MAG: Non-structural maintenance of chromosomes element 4 A, partial [Marteilia pararefringens]